MTQLSVYAYVAMVFYSKLFPFFRQFEYTMASASASVASTDETFIPEDLLERLLDSFNEDSDFDNNLVVEGDNGGTGDRPATELTDEEFDLSAQVEVADIFDGFSDDDSDDGDNVGPTENDEMRTILLMLDDEQLPTFDFTKSNTVSAVRQHSPDPPVFRRLATVMQLIFRHVLRRCFLIISRRRDE